MSGALAIGLGCRRGCSADVLVALVEAACAGLDRRGACLFTLDRKEGETGLAEAAKQLGMPLTFLDGAQLEAALPRVESRSASVAAAVGVPSVAEAAALAGAGPEARLVVSRRVLAGATCAIARAGEP